MVLEDNLRIPSGTAYAIVNRRLLTQHLPELDRPPDLGDVDEVPPMLLETLRASAPPRCSDEPSVALLSAGWEDSAWFEHTFLAEEMGIALVQSTDLSVRDGKLLRHIGSDVHPVDVLYARMDEDMLLSSTGYDGSAVAAGPARGGHQRDADHRQRARQRRRRRQGHLRLRAGDDRVLPGREARAGAGADLDLRRTRAA